MGSVVPGAASYADGSAHNADRLSRPRGSTKLTQAQIPTSGYELNGIATGILEIPAVEGYETAWTNTFGTGGLGWGLSFGLTPINVGGFTDAASGDGQVFFSTGTEIGTSPLGGADINTIRLSFVVSSGKWSVRVRWGTTSYDLAIESGSAQAFDPTVMTWFQVQMLTGASDCTLGISFTQVHPTLGWITHSLQTNSEAKDYVVHQFWVGGTEPERGPVFGVKSACQCIVTEVVLRANITATGASLTLAQDNPFTRMPDAPVLGNVPSLHDVWHLTDSTTEPESANGREALLVGNSVRRDSGITTQQGSSMRFDGSGMLTLRQSQVLREAPKPAASGGVDGHYLELPSWSLVLCVDPRRIPWRHPEVARGCFVCWSSPYAANLGVTSDPLWGTYPDGVRPSEHLRAEIQKSGTDYYLVAYFGELEPESLKHPPGTPGGSASTAWPPTLDTAGEPPSTWNMPQGDPTLAYTAGNGKTAFRIHLGADGDPTHPMDYGWWVFLQRKFVAQGSGSNACSLFVRRVALDGTLDTGFGEAQDANADGAGERHPANQSCFTAARLSSTDICFSPDNYAMSFGAGIGSRFGDEQKSYDATTRRPSIYPVDGGDVKFQFSDEMDAFPFIGRIASIAFLKKYLLPSDRARIATAGTFGTALRLQYGQDLLFSVNADEAAGNVIRDARGNDIAYADKAAVSSVVNDSSIQVPTVVGCFPRPDPPWHNEVTAFSNEYGRVNGIVQRIDSGGKEEVYVVARAGLYGYDRTAHALTRLTTLPGQGGSGQASLIVDNNDVIHIAGGPGRPVIVTRDKVVAVAGLDAPIYAAPSQIVTGTKSIAGGVSISFQSKTDTNPSNRTGYQIDDGATMQFAIGFWSDTLKTRSAPGSTVTCKFTKGATPDINTQYRALVSGLPIPRGPNASLVSHWEVYRTDSNGRQLLLEHKIPVGAVSPSTLIGDQQTLTQEADVFRSVPPEGMRAIISFGDRIVGIGIPEFPRGIAWTKRRDSMNWPALYYSANLNQTNAPASGLIVRRDRAFAFSRDYFYQLLETGADADPFSGLFTSVEVSPLIEGAGGISHFAATTDHENGIYLPGNKTVYLTEGGTYRSISIENDSSAGLDGNDFAWPDSWDLSEPDEFVAFHDEKRRYVGICGPSSDDPARRDAMLLYYEQTSQAADGRTVLSAVESSRVVGLDMTCAATVINQDTGAHDVWYGTSLGYLCRMGDTLTFGVDYDWLTAVEPKMGLVLQAPTTTTLRLDAAYTGYPTSDLMRGATLRLYRDDTLVSTRSIIQVTVGASWVDVVLDGAHSGKIGDTWTVGATPMTWISGKIDFGTLLQDKAVQSADLTMADAQE